jgi:hypothetical protein
MLESNCLELNNTNLIALALVVLVETEMFGGSLLRHKFCVLEGLIILVLIFKAKLTVLDCPQKSVYEQVMVPGVVATNEAESVVEVFPFDQE